MLNHQRHNYTLLSPWERGQGVRPLVKVCGMRYADNIREVEALGIDMMGFIFWPHSSRYVSKRPGYLPTNCKRAGVFVDATIETVKQHVADYGLNIVQLHGHETPEFIRQLRAIFGDSIAIIKVFNIATSNDFTLTRAYDGLADCFLFDTKGRSKGGNGEKFDWSLLADYEGHTPFLLSGGIGQNDAYALHSPSTLHALCIGVDLNSRFERSPGLKDVAALSKFIKQIKLPTGGDTPA